MLWYFIAFAGGLVAGIAATLLVMSWFVHDTNRHRKY